MVETIVIAFIVFLLAVTGMAVGAIVANKRLAGSCGGLSAIEGMDTCNVCGRDLSEAKETGTALDCDRA